MKIPIDKNIPLPSRNLSVSNVYPFAELEIGDSFFIEFHGEITETVFRTRTSSNCNLAQDRYKHKYSTRSQKELNKLIGIRVWRIE